MQIGHAATLLFEAPMAMPFRFSATDTKERKLIHGATFLRLDGDTIEYSVWIPRGTVGGSSLTIASTVLGESYDISLSPSGTLRLIGCGDLAPYNPWLPIPPDFFVGLPGPGGIGGVTCLAF
jgi:hypothetical protein